MMHSSTDAGSMPARRTASRTTIAPSCGAVNSFRVPRNLPVGVRTAETMTDSRITLSRHGVGGARIDSRGPDVRHHLNLLHFRSHQHLDADQDRVGGAFKFA